MSEMETLKELRRIAADFECSASAVPRALQREQVAHHHRWALSPFEDGRASN